MSSLISLNAGPGSTDTRLTGARRKRPIGLTALIDVVFILLMFFRIDLTELFNRVGADI